jgi:hypothetical protein
MILGFASASCRGFEIKLLNFKGKSQKDYSLFCLYEFDVLYAK